MRPDAIATSERQVVSPATQSWPSAKYAWYVVLMLTAAYGFAIVDRVALGLLVQPIEADLGINDSQMGLLQGFAFGIFYSLFGIPLGLVVDRWDRRRIVAIGMVLWSVATVFCGFVRNFGNLFVARIAVGVGEASLSPAASSIIADNFPPEVRPRAFGIYMLGTTFGSGLAFMLGGGAIALAERLRATAPSLLGSIAGWKIVFFLIGAPGIILALLFAMTVAEPVRRERLDHATTLSLGPALARLRASRRAYATLIGSAVLNLTCIYAQLGWFPTLFIRTHGWSAAHIGGVLGMIAVPMGILSSLGSGWVTTWLARRGHLDAPLLAVLVQSIGFIIFGTAACLVPSPVVALACYLIMGIPTAWSYAAALTGLNQITPNELRGQIVAIYTLLVGLVSLGAGSFAVGFLTDSVFGHDRVGSALATVYLVCGVSALALVTLGRESFRTAVRESSAWMEMGPAG